MTLKKKTPYGGIVISMDAVASLAGKAAKECYGVLGLADKGSLRQSIISILTKKEDFVKGVFAYSNKKEGCYRVDIYIIVAYGIKITEVVSEVQKKVRYVLTNTFQMKFNEINVYVADVKELD